MSVKIITGSIGSGKTKYCIERIAEVHAHNPNSRCIMLVPPHYTHETERMLINRFGGTGLNNIECTSLEKLARELLPSAHTLGSAGRNALVCRAVAYALRDIEDKPGFDRKLVRAVARHGFCDVAASLVSELRHYGIDSAALAAEAAAEKNPLLSQKLEILSVILEKYNKLLENADYRDTDDDLSQLAKILPDSFGHDDYIWIDKFDELLPQQTEAVYALIDSGADITITFNTCPDYNDTYYGTRAAISDICNYTSANTIQLTGEMEHINSPDLKFLFSNWHSRNRYSGNCENIRIFSARDPYSETEHTARKILDLVREDGFRFCDIGILLGSRDTYTHLIEAVFDEYEIPYYTDTKIAISEYPIAMQILALFDVIKHNWNYSSMFEYLRAGFVYTKKHSQNGKVKYARLDPDKLDVLENYVLKYGIEYKSAWCRSWLTPSNNIIDTAFSKPTHDSEASELLDDMRRTIIEPIENYNEGAKAARTVSDYCRVLFRFLEDINLYQGLKSELLQMALDDATSDAQRFGQIWNLILQILDEVNTALGSETVTHDEFCQYITAAMSQCEIRTVPSGIDRVYIGSADTNRAIPTPVMFVMGATAGTYPSISTQEGFLSDTDRTALLEKSIRLAPTTIKKAEKQSNMVYKLLSAVCDKLYISYPTMTADGATNLPSQMITDIQSIIPDIPTADDITDTDALYISSPKATMHRFLINPNDNPLWKHVSDWFSEHDEWKKRLIRVNGAKYRFSHRDIELSSELARTLYENKPRYSATRLNAYANCPFSHFMQYGLNAHERDEYEIKATDTGTYAHEIIQRFCNRVEDDATLGWDTLDDDKCTELVSELVSDTLDKVENSQLRDKEMTADILRRMGNTVREAAKTVSKSIRCGEFEIEGYEKSVTVRLTDNIELGGIIDRLDICRHDGVNEYRIIDYKTGSKAFSAADIYNGIDMQPVIYALAMRMLDSNATISGMYYSMVHNDFATADITSKQETITNALKSNTTYNGVTFVGNDTDEPIPTDEIDRIESELSRSDGSIFFGSKLAYGKSVRTRPEGQLLMDKVCDNIITADLDIRNGNIAISPITRSNSSACTYCPYSSVCKFDYEQRTERTIKEKDSDIWDILKEEM